MAEATIAVALDAQRSGRHASLFRAFIIYYQLATCELLYYLFYYTLLFLLLFVFFPSPGSHFIPNFCPFICNRINTHISGRQILYSIISLFRSCLTFSIPHIKFIKHNPSSMAPLYISPLVNKRGLHLTAPHYSLFGYHFILTPYFRLPVNSETQSTHKGKISSAHKGLFCLQLVFWDNLLLREFHVLLFTPANFTRRLLTSNVQLLYLSKL